MNTKHTLWIALAILLAGLLSLTGCGGIVDMISGSGNVVTQEYDFSDFDEVTISHAFAGTITQGDSYSVIVRVDDNLVDKLEVRQEGNRVTIGMQQVTMVNRATMEVDITLPSLTWIETSGASSAQLNGISSTADFRGEASGASRIHGDIAVGDLDLHASGASNISLAGTGGNVRADASGASTIDLEELSANDANVTASGASNVTVNAGGRLDADASGGSNIYYVGNPQMGDIEDSGGSNIEQR